MDNNTILWKKYLEFYKISPDGFSVYQNNDYYIFYNPYQHKNIINFTLAHEVGHIALYHHVLLNKPLLTKGMNNIAERQANIFARNILMPPEETLEWLEYKDERELTKIYDLSFAMIRNRIRSLNYDINWLNAIDI